MREGRRGRGREKGEDKRFELHTLCLLVEANPRKKREELLLHKHHACMRPETTIFFIHKSLFMAPYGYSYN